MDRTSDSYKDTKRALESLNDIMLRDDPSQAENLRIQITEKLSGLSAKKETPISEEDLLRKRYRFIEPPTECSETLSSPL